MYGVTRIQIGKVRERNLVEVIFELSFKKIMEIDKYRSLDE